MVTFTMADFSETLFVTQVDANDYNYMWLKHDLTDNVLVSLARRSHCSGEELFGALEFYGFDTDRVFNHFEDYPLSTIILKDEY